MKLQTWQIVGLILLVFIHFRGADIIGPAPFQPDLVAEEMESKGLAGMLVLVDTDPVIQPTPQPIPDPQGAPPSASDPQDDQVVVPQFTGRLPRTILLTDTKNCMPCRQVDRMIVDVLKTPKFKKVGWEVGKEDDKALQVIDLSRDPNLFYEVANKLGKSSPSFQLSVPTFIRVDGKGQIQKIEVGSISIQKFFELSGAK